MKKHLFSLLLCLFFFATSNAQLRLGAPFTDHMVLQRNSTVSIWGWADYSSAGIEVSVSWNDEIYKTLSNGHTKWEVRIPTPEAGGPYEIKINNSLIIKDVLIGEVWVCSGQSNMEWSALSGIDNAEAAIKGANNDQIRLLKVPRMGSKYPQEDCAINWEICSSETMPSFSAVAYFFGKELQEKLNIPIGLIQSAWGGTAAEVWTPEPIIKADSDFSNWKNVFPQNDYHPSEPGVLYNAMIHPLIPYDVAGVIWYQGETNTANPSTYRRLFPAMIKSWREAWKKDFSFYYVQIAPFNYQNPMVGALLRETQLKSMAIDKAGMVVIDDIGNIEDIHPQNKQDVGKRLAYWALNKDYGQDIIYSGPIYESMEQRGNFLTINFQHADGMHFKGMHAEEVFIAGEDGIFYPADAIIKNNTLIVSHPKVPNPKSVRYAFSNTATGNLFNSADLPASSFRTDDWLVILMPVEITLSKKEKEVMVNLETVKEVDEIRYTLDGSTPGPDSKTFTAPFAIKKGVSIKARAVVNKKYSEAISEKEIVINKSTFSEVSLVYEYSDRYKSSGKNALTDGIKGGLRYGDGNWQGYLESDIVATIDLGEVSMINKVTINFLQDQKSWIFLPKQVEILVSENGRDFTTVLVQENTLSKNDIVEIQTVVKKSVYKKARYIRLIAKNAGPCPEWHPGAGGDTWLFVDEVMVH